jgi:hypothetical protein
MFSPKAQAKLLAFTCAAYDTLAKPFRFSLAGEIIATIGKFSVF